MGTSGKHTGPRLKTSAHCTKGGHRIRTPRPAVHPQEARHSVPSHGGHVPPAATTGQAQAHPSTRRAPSSRAISRLSASAAGVTRCKTRQNTMCKSDKFPKLCLNSTYVVF